MKPILTAVQGTNADLFPSALALYADFGEAILDMTYGLGVFWRNVDTEAYDVFKNDIDPKRGDYHEDFRHTHFDDCAFSVVVLDPPYASRSSNKKSFVGSLYNNGNHHLDTVEDMLKFYYDGMSEAKRLLEPGGYLMVKCMDEISGGKQKRNHISILEYAVGTLKMVDEDLFVLVSSGVPVMRHDHQLHARKNNSFLWVFRKTDN